MAENFERWFSKKHGDYNLNEESGYYARDGWDAAKDKIFNTLNSLHSVPNTKVSLNEILALMKEKL